MSFGLLDLADEILREGDICRCGIGDTVGNQGLDNIFFPHLFPILPGVVVVQAP